MKHKISKVATAMLLAGSLPVSAEMCSSFNPYVGADAQYRYMPFEKDYGGNIFKKTSPQANFYIGNRFNEYFGLEFGYSTSKKVKRNVVLTPGQFVAGGDPILAGATNAVHGTSKISGFSLNALGFLPVPSIDCLEVVGSLGLTRLKARLLYREVGDAANPILTDTDRNFSASKTVMHLGGGLRYSLTERLSIRGLVNWENTKRFKNVKARESANPTVKMKNSITYSLGLNFSF